MSEKVEELRQSPADEKEIDESVEAAAVAGDTATADSILDNSSGQDDAGGSGGGGGERRVVSAHHQHKQDGIFWRVLKFIFYIPLKMLALLGFNVWQANLHVSGVDKIDKSPLRPASTSPQKRKRGEQEASSDECEDVEEVARLLEDDEDYDSQEDKDFKPGDESTCSEEYAEGDTEAELSKLSIEDVSEPRPSALRNIVDVDPAAEGIGTDEIKPTNKKEATVFPTKCIDDPISKTDISPATVGVVG